MPILSVILPFNNPGIHFPGTVFSILSAGFSDLELLLINDGSVNNDFDWIYKISDKRVRVFDYDECLGISVRLNQHVPKCLGDFIARMDCDDFVLPGRFERQVEVLRDRSDNCVVIGPAIMFELQECRRIIQSRKIIDKLNWWSTIRILHPTVAAKTTWFYKNNYNESLLRAQDRELWVRSSKLGTIFISVDEPVLLYSSPRSYSLVQLARKYWHEAISLSKVCSRFALPFVAGFIFVKFLVRLLHNQIKISSRERYLEYDKLLATFQCIRCSEGLFYSELTCAATSIRNYERNVSQ